MENKLEPIKCCTSGCNEWGDELTGWWGPFLFCTKHNQELLDQYAKDVDAGMFEENIMLDCNIFGTEDEEK